MSGVELGIPVKIEDEKEIPQLQFGEEIRWTQVATELYINTFCAGSGTLFLATKRLYWILTNMLQTAPSINKPSLGIDYSVIGLHALCQDTAQYKAVRDFKFSDGWCKPCLYCQVDLELEAFSEILNTNTDELKSDTDEEDEPCVVELRLVPIDSSTLPVMFRIFSEMSSLNPDDAIQTSDSKCFMDFQESDESEE